MKVTVLIINYKNWHDTIECLESVFKSNHKDLEVIVVDNSPDNTSITKLEEWTKGALNVNQTRYPELVFPEITKPLECVLLSEEEFYTSQTTKLLTIVKAKNNNGFAAANNIFLKKKLQQKKTGEFVFLLNNDTVIPPDTITNLIKNIKKEPKIGLAGCTLLEYNNSTKIQSVGGVYSPFFGITKQALEGVSLEGLKALKSKIKIDYPAGAAMFLSTEVLRTLGLLNEEYFLYFEELDWVKKGESQYQTTYFDDCFVYHKGGESIGSNKKSYISDKYSIINRINFAKKHNKKFIATVYLGVFLAVFKRFLALKFNRCFCLIKDLMKNENEN